MWKILNSYSKNYDEEHRKREKYSPLRLRPRTLEEHESCFVLVFSLELFHSSLSFIKHRRGVTGVVFVAFLLIPVVSNLLTSSQRKNFTPFKTHFGPSKAFVYSLRGWFFFNKKILVTPVKIMSDVTKLLTWIIYYYLTT